MASVLGWLPQSAGAVRAWAGWPGSNGSTMAANGGTVLAAGAEARPDGDVVAGPVLDEDEELPLLPQPAAVKPIRAANTAARATYRPIHATSAIPPVLAMIVAGQPVAGPEDRMTARTSAATAPEGLQMSGLMSSASRRSPRSQASSDRPAMAPAIASRSAGRWPRAPGRTAASRGRGRTTRALERVAGGSTTLRSEKISIKTPPALMTRRGPRAASRTRPRASSVPGAAVWHTRTRGPRRAARSS